jgi:iron complex transport system substrate-binding protein
VFDMLLKLLPITGLLVALAIAVCGCSTVTPTATPAPELSAPFPVNLTDNWGSTVTLDKAPERIVSLSPSNTEMLFAIGAGDRIVGDTNYCDYPAEAKNITHVSGFSTVSFENIATVNPDLIFAEDIIREDSINRLKGMGYNVIVFMNDNLTMVRKNIEVMGKATGSVSNATAIVNDMDRLVNEIRSKVPQQDNASRPKILLLAGYVAGKEIHTYGTDTFGDEIISLVAGKNAAGNITGFKVMSPEAIVLEDPDYIVIPVDGNMATVYDYNYFKNGTDSWMKGLKAVKNGNVIMIEGSFFTRPGPRIPEAAMAIAKALYPDQFP